jgi:predicted lipid-binding transport protein (Tim44 family)
MAETPPTQPEQPIQPPQQPAQANAQQQPQQPMQGYMRVEPKKPWRAALLGLIFLGLGLFYVGKWGYGILLIIVGVIVSVFTAGLAAPIFWIISIVWSYTAAKSYNRQAGYPG